MKKVKCVSSISTNSSKTKITRIFLICAGVLIGLLILSGFALTHTNSKAHAATKSTGVHVTVDAACTMSSSVTSNHTATLTNGGYNNTGIGSTTVTVICNDSQGYAVYAVGYSGDTEGNTNLIGSTSGQTIATGTSLNGTVSNWAMKLAAAGTTDVPTIVSTYSSMAAVPSSYTKVAYYNSQTTTSAGSQFTTTYGASVSPTQAADTYVGKVSYKLVHPTAANSNNVTSFNNAFANAGATKTDGYYPMQSMTTQICAAVTNSQTATLIDTRDSSTYTVAKIDGSCWMTQNLRLAAGIALTSSTSNVSSNYTTPTAELTNGNSYTASYQSCSTDTGIGCWYNYCTATAGTICTSSKSTVASKDICPKGWRLPSDAEIGYVINYKTLFNPSTGGRYYSGAIQDTGKSYYWTNTASSGTVRYILNYTGSTLESATLNRHYGAYVRCMKS